MTKTVNIDNFIGVYDGYISQEECKHAINLYENEDKFNQTVAEHTDKIIKSRKLKQVNFLARSAGGGVALRIAQINRNENNPDYIGELNLCAPGYKYSGLEDFLNARHNTEMESIPIKITWSKKDPTINVEKGNKMERQLKKAEYPNFIYEELDIDGEETAGVHHRIHPSTAHRASLKRRRVAKRY